MDIKEYKKFKNECCLDILEIICEFEEKTGVSVDDLSIDILGSFIGNGKINKDRVIRLKTDIDG